MITPARVAIFRRKGALQLAGARDSTELAEFCSAAEGFYLVLSAEKVQD